VNLIITAWSSGTGDEAFDELVADTGYCHWLDPQTEGSFSSALSDQSWSGTSTNSSLNYGRAVIRIGDVIAGVEVQDADGTEAAARVADQLGIVISKRLLEAGVDRAE
jgi:hypothetical protein